MPDLDKIKRKKTTLPTRTLVDFVNSDLAFGRTSFLIVWSLMYFFIVLNTLMAASCVQTSQTDKPTIIKICFKTNGSNRFALKATCVTKSE